MQIINITNPASPSPAAAVTDGAVYTELNGAYGITTHTIGSSHYALVASITDDGVQIIDITNPASPSPAGAVTDGTDYPELDGAFGIATHTIGTSHYALVAATNATGCRSSTSQIQRIRHPKPPSPTAATILRSTGPGASSRTQ